MGDETTQNDRGFPGPDEFDSYDEVESTDGQAELPDDSYVLPDTDEDEDGCECA